MFTDILVRLLFHPTQVRQFLPTTTPDWSFPFHEHGSQMEISLVLSGKEQMVLEDSLYQLEEGDLVVKHPHTIHSERSLASAPVKQTAILLEGVRLEGLKQNFLFTDGSCCVFYLGEYKELVSSLFLYLEKTTKTGKECKDAFNLLFSLIREIKEKGQAKDSIRKNLEDVVAEVKKYLDKNFCSRILLEDLAKRFFVSPFHLDRKFKEIIGYSIRKYLIEMRMGLAANQLVFSDLPIKDIAASCGYEDIHYFYSVFHRFTKMSPATYRRKYITKHTRLERQNNRTN